MAKTVKKPAKSRGAQHLLRGLSRDLVRRIDWYKVDKSLTSRNEAILDLLNKNAPDLPRAQS
jgi:hypothetical protein